GLIEAQGDDPLHESQRGSRSQPADPEGTDHHQQGADGAEDDGAQRAAAHVTRFPLLQEPRGWVVGHDSMAAQGTVPSPSSVPPGCSPESYPAAADSLHRAHGRAGGGVRLREWLNLTNTSSGSTAR